MLAKTLPLLQHPAERTPPAVYYIITGTTKLRFPFHAQGLHAASETSREPCVGYREELKVPGVAYLIGREGNFSWT